MSDESEDEPTEQSYDQSMAQAKKLAELKENNKNLKIISQNYNQMNEHVADIGASATESKLTADVLQSCYKTATQGISKKKPEQLEMAEKIKA